MKKTKINNLDRLYNEIENIQKKETFGLLERICKLQEELGELSAEVLKSINYKKSKLSKDEISENILLESIDCLIMSMDIIAYQGHNKDRILEIAESQIKKWKSNL